ncbi:MAG: hypothetical protein JNM17_04045 [Archangium sp.]|nr:hypothetical protein [Archangium sp.]
MSRQSSSDPLPYVQVDRAVKPKATLLANALGVTPQHATGSLVEFWELCGDPRELEAIVMSTPADIEPEVVLQPDDLRLRFKLASGHDLDPAVMARLGLVEPRDKAFRVRGMSRYFEPIQKRIQARDAAAKGGKASVESRKKKTGTAQPQGGKGSENRSDERSEPAQAVAQPPTEAEPKRKPKRDGSATEAEPNPSGQRSAVSDLRGSMSSPFEQPRAGAVEKPPTPVENSKGEDQNSRWLIEADAFIDWAQQQAPEIGDAGPSARAWAQGFFLKYQPENVDLIRVAFVKFLTWVSMQKLKVGWGLWIQEKVWEPRWADVRAEASKRGVA